MAFKTGLLADLEPMFIPRLTYAKIFVVARLGQLQNQYLNFVRIQIAEDAE